MDFTAKPQSAELSEQDKHAVSLLIVEPSELLQRRLNTILAKIGVANISMTDDHLIGKRRLSQREFTHVLFSMKPTSLGPREFLADLLSQSPDTAAIAVAAQPDVDEVFELLVLGARGYLLEPFAEETLEGALAIAMNGKAIPDSVLHAKERNLVLVEFMADSLDDLAEALKAARSSGAARAEIPKLMAAFRDSVNLAKTFKEGDEESLLSSIETFCLKRSEGPATKLGRARKRIREERMRKRATKSES